MLRTGLTGGIGAGKSTIANRLVERGAVLVDSDRLAREVVAGDTPGLAAIVGEFGSAVLTPAGELDRPALASIVFGDPDARRTLDGIVHPLVRSRSEAEIAAAPADSIVVQDIPLLVEGGMAVWFPLVVVVGVDAEERVRRLVTDRGMTEGDARARMAAQATDEQRRAAADVWLDNSGERAAARRQADALWEGRLVPFEENLRLRRPVPQGPPVLTGPDPAWAEQARRLAGRVAAAAGMRGRGVEHIGATAVPGLPARDVLDLQLAVECRADAEPVTEALLAAGFPDDPDAALTAGTVAVHRSADPGRPAVVVVRVHGSPGWQHALGIRERLRADDRAREGYAERLHSAAAAYGNDPDPGRYSAYTAAWRGDPDE